MALYNQDFVLESNTDLVLAIEVKRANGDLIQKSDIEGATWGITRFQEDSGELISKSLGSGISVPEDGIVNVLINGSDTADLSGEFSHELRLGESGGASRSLARGRLTINYQIANNPI